MRVLADENFPRPAVLLLQAHGHDVVWIRDQAPGIPDDEVVARSMAEGRILLTFDKGFGEMARRHRVPITSGVVLFRIQTRDPQEAAEVVVKALESRDDWAGRFAVVNNSGIRSFKE